MQEIAQKLYDGEAPTYKWLEAFTPMELVKLWYDLCIYRPAKDGKLIGPEAYDDEVYNALDYLGYWDIKTEKGEK